KNRHSNEIRHEVEITRPFALGVCPVTQEEYHALMGRTPSQFSAKGEWKGYKDAVKGLKTGRFPVETVSWEEANQFCEKLSAGAKEKAAGRIYRLPTEAEWEYACRAGTTTPFHYGESLSAEQANFNGNHPYGGAAKGQYLKRPTTVGS